MAPKHFSVCVMLAVLSTGGRKSALADPVVLSVTGMVTSSTANGTSLGAGDYTSDQLNAAGALVGTVTGDGVTGIPLWSLLGGFKASMPERPV